MARGIARLVVFVCACLTLPAWPAGSPVRIGLDAEFGHQTSTSAQAIERGIRVAIDEINRAGGVLGGRPLELVTRDNRSITAMGKDNLRELAAIPDLVAVFGGKFSPIYVECVPLAHELGVLLLDPWGSADPIIDHHYRPSYTFRLSLRDGWAAPALLKFARERHGARRVGVLLPNTAWGRSNQAALERAAAAQGVIITAARWFNWGDPTLIGQYRELRASGAQAIVLVSNEVEGAVFVRELAALPAAERLPVISHWGITGGNFAESSGEALAQVDLAVIQTFSFEGLDTPVARQVLAAARRLFGIGSAAEIRSPVGFAQAYDLTRLLARAIDQAGSTDRARIRSALERLGPYDGLLQRYPRPFTAGRHEALSPANLHFARYGNDERLIPLGRLPAR